MSVHYHIRWSDTPNVDWQAFNSLADAEQAANELKREGEMYSIEQFDENCSVCRGLVRLKAKAGGSSV